MESEFDSIYKCYLAAFAKVRAGSVPPDQQLNLKEICAVALGTIHGRDIHATILCKIQLLSKIKELCSDIVVE